MTILTLKERKGTKKKRDKSIFGPCKIRGNQMAAGFHLTPLPTLKLVSLPDCTNQNSIEGNGCVNLLDTKEITTEKSPKPKDNPVS